MSRGENIEVQQEYDDVNSAYPPLPEDSSRTLAAYDQRKIPPQFFLGGSTSPVQPIRCPCSKVMEKGSSEL